MNAHPLVVKLAAAQREQRDILSRTIDATNDFIVRRVKSASHKRARTVLAWATAQHVAQSPCFVALAQAVAADAFVAALLMACWTDFPSCQEAA